MASDSPKSKPKPVSELTEEQLETIAGGSYAEAPAYDSRTGRYISKEEFDKLVEEDSDELHYIVGG